MAIVWLVGHETSLNQNQKGTEWEGVGDMAEIQNPVLPARQAPPVKQIHAGDLASRHPRLPDSLTWAQNWILHPGWVFNYFVQK